MDRNVSSSYLHHNDIGSPGLTMDCIQSSPVYPLSHDLTYLSRNTFDTGQSVDLGLPLSAGDSQVPFEPEEWKDVLSFFCADSGTTNLNNSNIHHSIFNVSKVNSVMCSQNHQTNNVKNIYSGHGGANPVLHASNNHTNKFDGNTSYSPIRKPPFPMNDGFNGKNKTSTIKNNSDNDNSMGNNGKTGTNKAPWLSQYEYSTHEQLSGADLAASTVSLSTKLGINLSLPDSTNTNIDSSTQPLTSKPWNSNLSQGALKVKVGGRCTPPPCQSGVCLNKASNENSTNNSVSGIDDVKTCSYGVSCNPPSLSEVSEADIIYSSNDFEPPPYRTGTALRLANASSTNDIKDFKFMTDSNVIDNNQTNVDVCGDNAASCRIQRLKRNTSSFSLSGLYD